MIYRLKLMFEWRGGTLWSDNEAARARFGIGSIEELLGLDPALLERLEELSVWHDTALDWDDPGGPSPWSDEELERFYQAAGAVREEVARALGPDFEVTYPRF